MNTRMRNKDGQLSQYAFACGYIQREETETQWLDLYHDGACYHVKYYNFETGEKSWDCFAMGELTQARKHWHKLKRQYFKKA